MASTVTTIDHATVEEIVATWPDTPKDQVE